MCSNGVGEKGVGRATGSDLFGSDVVSVQFAGGTSGGSAGRSGTGDGTRGRGGVGARRVVALEVVEKGGKAEDAGGDVCELLFTHRLFKGGVVDGHPTLVFCLGPDAPHVREETEVPGARRVEAVEKEVRSVGKGGLGKEALPADASKVRFVGGEFAKQGKVDLVELSIREGTFECGDQRFGVSEGVVLEGKLGKGVCPLDGGRDEEREQRIPDKSTTVRGPRVDVRGVC